MAKQKPTIPRPSSMRFLRNLSTISRTPTPSSALLAILAGLVGSVNPFPVACHELDAPPPAFLCPSLQPRAKAQVFAPPPRTSPPSCSTPGPSRIARRDTPTSSPGRYEARALAPGYTQGPDGRWRIISSWTLYGSTICVCHDASSTAGTQPMDDLASSPTPSLPSETELLPPGWSRTSEESTTRTVLILSLSLVLASLIAVFIFFLLWRRRRNRELRKDLEKKLVARRESHNDDSEKEHRTKEKLWARATTRWKENIRQSARRRRNARLSNTSLHAPNNSALSFSRTSSSTSSSPHSRAASLPPSRASSPAPANPTVSSIHSSMCRTDHEPQNIHIEPPSPSPSSSPPLPPAYQHGSHLSADVSPAKDPSQLSSGSSLYASHLSHVDSIHSDSPPPSPLESDMSPSSIRAAHVATDDKALLQQMEVMGSQPPAELDSSDVHGSAPILYEDDVQPFEPGDVPETITSPMGFPLPPTAVPSSKGKAAAFGFYDCDVLNVEPDFQPSAPPFEAEDPTLPSAPPDAQTQPLPSAPPEVADSNDDPTADAALPHEIGSHAVDTDRLGPSGPESLPQYRP